MDIYTVIRNDHNKAKEVIAEIKALPNERHAKRMELFRPLMEDLIAHNESEESSFYVALRKHSKTKEDAKHSETEHHEANSKLEDLDDDDLSPEEWSKNFNEVVKALMHHISKEESKVFSEARSVLSESDATKLAHEMQQLKKQKKTLLKKAS